MAGASLDRPLVTIPYPTANRRTDASRRLHGTRRTSLLAGPSRAVQKSRQPVRRYRDRVMETRPRRRGDRPDARASVSCVCVRLAWPHDLAAVFFRGCGHRTYTGNDGARSNASYARPVNGHRTKWYIRYHAFVVVTARTRLAE